MSQYIETDIVQGKEAQEKLLIGLKKGEAAVGSTMGGKGQTVIIS